MEERVAEGRERRRFDVQGFNARIYFGEFSPTSLPTGSPAREVAVLFD
jgi:hypothetical protein